MAILPIVTWNDPVLKQKTDPVQENSQELQTLIDDMFDTMYHASGVGLASPQIGRRLRLFVVDADEISQEYDEPSFGPMVFINPEITRKGGEVVSMEEGCLSIPEVRDDVKRPSEITIRFLDRNFQEQKISFDGLLSRVIQHEYDHIEGILFLDHLSAFRRRLHRSKLRKIEEGSMKTDYPLVEKRDLKSK